MGNAKLQDIIERKNDQLERRALDEAAGLIESIASKQILIVKTEGEIKELRERLHSLEIQQLDSVAILGTEEAS